MAEASAKRVRLAPRTKTAPRAVHQTTWGGEATYHEAYVLPDPSTALMDKDVFTLLTGNSRERTKRPKPTNKDELDDWNAVAVTGRYNFDDDIHNRCEYRYIDLEDEAEFKSEANFVLVYKRRLFFVSKAAVSASCALVQRIVGDNELWSAVTRADTAWHYKGTVQSLAYEFSMNAFEVDDPYDIDPDTDLPNGIHAESLAQAPHVIHGDVLVFESLRRSHVEAIVFETRRVLREITDCSSGEDVVYLERSSDDVALDAKSLISDNPRLTVAGDARDYDFHY